MSKIGEFRLIEVIQKNLAPVTSRLSTGVGDDAAVIETSGMKKLLMCSDAMVEGVHFELETTPVKELGYKAVASCLSDIAAMGGRPVAVTISIALPKRENLDLEIFVRRFYEGVQRLQKDLAPIEFDVVGGDLSSSPTSIFIDVAVTGETDQAILRSGARPGDILAVSGNPGTSAAGLYAMKNWKTLRELSGRLMQAHNLPRPRFDLSTQLDPMTCHALIDVSDGVASEAFHLAQSSNVSIEIAAERLPFDERALALAKRTNQSMLDWALYGGEDYELLGAFEASGPLPEGFTAIGLVTKLAGEKPDVTLVKLSGERELLEARGFNHFP